MQDASIAHQPDSADDDFMHTTNQLVYSFGIVVARVLSSKSSRDLTAVALSHESLLRASPYEQLSFLAS